MAGGGPDGKPGTIRCMIRDIRWRRQAEEMHRQNLRLAARVATRTLELSETNEALRGEVAERKRLATEVVRVSEAERQRIGQDLHDSLGQNLTGLAFLSADLQRGTSARRLTAARQAGAITGRLNEDDLPPPGPWPGASARWS